MDNRFNQDANKKAETSIPLYKFILAVAAIAVIVSFSVLTATGKLYFKSDSENKESPSATSQVTEETSSDFDYTHSSVDEEKKNTEPKIITEKEKEKEEEEHTVNQHYESYTKPTHTSSKTKTVRRNSISNNSVTKPTRPASENNTKSTTENSSKATTENSSKSQIENSSKSQIENNSKSNTRPDKANIPVDDNNSSAKTKPYARSSIITNN